MRRSINMMLSDTPPTCKACSLDAVIYCFDCKVFLCPTHVLQHKEIFASEHKTIDTKEYLKNINNNISFKSDDSKCTKHEKSREFYCEDCFELICSSCFVSHLKHTILLMDDYSEKQRVKLRNMSESLVLKSQEILETIEQGRKFIDKKSIELKDILDNIESIKKISLETSSYELLDRERFQHLFNFVQHKYLRKVTGFSSLPKDLWQYIFSKLTFVQLMQTSTVCSEWKNSIPQSITSIEFDEFEYYIKYWDKKELKINWKDFVNVKCIELGRVKYDKIITEDVLKSFGDLQTLSFGPNAEIEDKYLKKLTNLTVLDLDNSTISDEGIKELTNLNALCLSNLEEFEENESSGITDEGIKRLTNLTTLATSELITNDGIKWLINLNSLFNFNSKITDIGFQRLTNLTFLYNISKDNITNSALSKLVNLRTLIIPYSKKITDAGVKKLTNLTHLAIGRYISYEGIKPLTKLLKLSIRKGKFTDDDIRNLTYLNELSIDGSNIISDEGISVLTNLQKLKIDETSITNIGIQELTRLVSLQLVNIPTITDEGISRLSNLTKFFLT